MDHRPSELEEQLRRATTAAADGSGSREQLEAAARALVIALRSADEPPEQMLVRIKEILADAGLRPAYASTDLAAPLRGEPAIYRSVIEWSIRQYYDDFKSDHQGDQKGDQKGDRGDHRGDHAHDGDGRATS